MTVVMKDGSGPFALPIKSFVHADTFPPNLADSEVHLVCASADEDLTINVWDGDNLVGTVVVGAGPLVDAAAPVQPVQASQPVPAGSITWPTRSELKHRAVAFAAKQLPPSVKAAIKKHIWKP
jgi:hypothetical protein